MGEAPSGGSCASQRVDGGYLTEKDPDHEWMGSKNIKTVIKSTGIPTLMKTVDSCSRQTL
jgi:hypothetical protein